MTKKQTSSLIVAILSVALSACVTQEFENNDTPVVKNQANRDDMAATRISLGLGYLRMGNMAQAKQNLEKAKKFSPKMVQVYTAFAHYYETVGENELAVSSFETALSIKSDDADTLNNYGVYLCRQGLTEAAEKQFLKAIAVPSYVLVAKSYENLASCFLKKDNFTKAEVYLNKAIMHSPGNSSILFQMVRLQYALGEFEKAKFYEQRFEKVTRRFTPESLALAFKVYWKLGQRRTAKNYAAMLVKMYPQSWESKQYLLNELELIEADSLAKRYQLTKAAKVDTKSKKRVVKLSPKKVLSSSVRDKPNIVERETVEQKATDEVITATKPALVSEPIEDKSGKQKRVVVLMTPKVEKISAEKLPPETASVLVASVEKKLDTVDSKIVKKQPVTKKVIKESKVVKQTLSVEKEQAPDRIKKTPDFHKVVAGDTLYSISIKYNIKIKALRRWNNLTSRKKIRINDKLYLTDPKAVIE